MSTKLTKEKICALSQEERYNIWNNAKRLGADDVVRMIEECGLPYTDPKGFLLDSPIGREMARVINSPQGIAAAIEATNQGRPALGGVDPLLKAALLEKYEKTHEATIQAGYLVAKMMREHGYDQTGRKGALLGCVAKSGEIYVKFK